MDLNQIRLIVNHFFNNYNEDMHHFARNNQNVAPCRVITIIRGLSDDTFLENEIPRIITAILRRVEQLHLEINRYNDYMNNIIDNNRWINFYDNAQLFIRALNASAGFLLVTHSQINIPFNVRDDIYNQLGLGFLNDNLDNNYINQEELN